MIMLLQRLIIYYNLLMVSTKKKKNAANALTPINVILFRITKNVMGACESVHLCFIVV